MKVSFINHLLNFFCANYTEDDVLDRHQELTYILMIF